MRTITGLRIGAAAATAATGTIVALAIIPGSAGAAFDPGFSASCQGDASIAGRGASFQRTAHLAWGASSVVASPAPATAVGFGYATAANGGCGQFKLSTDGGSTSVSFDPQGSGEGRGVVGATTSVDTAAGAPKGAPGIRKTELQFAAADEPPKPAEIAAANAGPDGATGTADDAVLYTVPVAQSSVATVVQLPTGCTVPNNAQSRRITRDALEGAFAASPAFTTWGSILPNIAGADAAGTDACKAKVFKRVVRLDSSGTTYGLKNYLRDIKATDFPATLGNTDWPNNTGTSAVVRADANGGGSLMDKLKTQTTDGGIAYADLATARSKGFDTETGAAGDTDQTIWLSVQRKGSDVYESPALDNAKGTTNTGANCLSVSYKDVTTGALPSVTQSWYDVTGSSSATDFPICALTYELVWEDLAKANVGHAAGAPDYTQAQARAVKDYLGYILNIGGGQAALAPAGYLGLPTVVGGAAQSGSVLAIARAAQQSLTWNKQTVVDPGTGGGDGGTPTTPVTTPTTPVTTPTTPVTTPTTPTTPTKPAATPAPKVSVSKATAVKGRKITLSVSPSAAGKVSVSATTGTGKKRVTVLSGSATAKKSGALKITLKPTSKGKKALKSGKSVKISFKVTFTNAAGKKTTVTKSIKVKIKG